MSPARTTRGAVAATDLAVLLPLLAYLFVIGVDWSWVFYYSIIIDRSQYISYNLKAAPRQEGQPVGV